MKTGLFSGTFDPIHSGHIIVAEAARAQLGLDEVWMLVNGDPSHKQPHHSFDDRLAFVREVTQDLPHIIVDREPVQQANNQHSQATTQQLLKAYPDHDFTLIVGADVFNMMQHWEGVDQLVQHMQVAVAPRINYPVSAHLAHTLLNMDYVDVSSSSIKAVKSR